MGKHREIKELVFSVLKMKDVNKIKEEFAKTLLSWHSENFLKFPWRETRDKYKILLAEMLLRKTTRNQVMKLYRKLVRKYPNPRSLASADVAELEKMIEPLGMQKKRATLLVRLANYIVNAHGGRIPDDINQIRKFPGVGPYTANAVLCLAYNRPLPLVDTNVIRVIKRVFGIRSKKKRERTDPEIWSFVGNLIPKQRGRTFNLAILDFASVVCTATFPKCPFCPIRRICAYPNKTR